MSSRSWGRIRIGGTLPGLKFRTFCRETMWHDILALAQSAGEHDDVVMERGLLSIQDSEGSGGTFEELEEWCIKNDVPFDRDSDGLSGEYGTETVQWRPGMDKPYVAACLDDEYEPVVNVKTVRAGLDDPAALRAWLDQNHPIIPPLSPLEVVGEAVEAEGIEEKEKVNR